MAIIALIIVAIFIACFCNDSSLLLAILKYGGIIIGLFVFMYLIVTCPWVLILGIIGLIVFCIAQSDSSNRNNVNKTQYQNNTYISQHNDVTNNQNNQSLTKFQAELQENTRTPQQALDEQWEREKNEVKRKAESAYGTIKSQLLSKAKNGNYTINNGRKRIEYVYESDYLTKCINRHHTQNPTGKMFTRSYNPHDKVTYTISKQKEYDYFISILKNSANNDGMIITPVFRKEQTGGAIDLYSLPYIDNEQMCFINHMKVYLICTIQY